MNLLPVKNREITNTPYNANVIRSNQDHHSLVYQTSEYIHSALLCNAVYHNKGTVDIGSHIAPNGPAGIVPHAASRAPQDVLHLNATNAIVMVYEPEAGRGTMCAYVRAILVRESQV